MSDSSKAKKRPRPVITMRELRDPTSTRRASESDVSEPIPIPLPAGHHARLRSASGSSLPSPSRSVGTQTPTETFHFEFPDRYDSSDPDIDSHSYPTRLSEWDSSTESNSWGRRFRHLSFRIIERVRGSITRGVLPDVVPGMLLSSDQGYEGSTDSGGIESVGQQLRSIGDDYDRSRLTRSRSLSLLQLFLQGRRRGSAP